MKDPNPNRNASENASSKGFSPPGGKTSGGQKLSQHPPAAGAHAPKSVHVISGGHNAGGSVIHPSLRKGK
jgi:hypothetical protein